MIAVREEWKSGPSKSGKGAVSIAMFTVAVDRKLGCTSHDPTFDYGFAIRCRKHPEFVSVTHFGSVDKV